MDAPRTKVISATFLKRFGALKDPRKEALCSHLLVDIVVIAILAVICGADGWDELVAFGKEKEEFLRTFLVLESGIPSVSTFQRVFARMHPKSFEAAFAGWVEDLRSISEAAMDAIGRPGVAFDGKTVRGSANTFIGGRAIHVVHAWSVQHRLLLGQYATDAKSNEITAIPELIKLLDLTGTIVTSDAMGCQTAIAAQIIEAGADYLIAVKDNQPTLHKAVIEKLEAARASTPTVVSSTATDTNSGHGRQEVRSVWAVDASDIPGADRWSKFASCILVESERRSNGRVSREHRHYISSLPFDDAKALGEVVRGHWGVENNLHWSLDVAFREDASKIYADHGPQNFSTLRKIALTALTRSPGKGSVATRRKRAGWNDQYLLNVLRCGTTG